MQAIAPTISHENEIYVREVSATYLLFTEVLQVLTIAPDASVVRFELEDLAGARFTRTCPPRHAAVAAVRDL